MGSLFDYINRVILIYTDMELISNIVMKFQRQIVWKKNPWKEEKYSE